MARTAWLNLPKLQIYKHVYILKTYMINNTVLIKLIIYPIFFLQGRKHTHTHLSSCREGNTHTFVETTLTTKEFINT